MQASTAEDLRALTHAAARAAPDLRARRPAELAAMLRAVADHIDLLGEELIELAMAETGLGHDRLVGEKARTTGQLRLFADVVAEGAHLDVVIDHGDPGETPPRPDLRRMLIPLGPVAVFGASNFPLAFGVAGGDTASALAAGNPVLAKPHPSNAGTSRLVADAVQRGVASVGFPDGTFGVVVEEGHELGAAMVADPVVAAVGFTGSAQGGRALFDIAARRPDPIPVHAEMGSLNPLWALPGAVAAHGAELADGLAASATLGMGQFCTKPGVLFLADSGASTGFLERLSAGLAAVPPGPMLDSRLSEAFHQRVEDLAQRHGVRQLVPHRGPDGPGAWAAPVLLRCELDRWLHDPALREECFGPALMAIVTDSAGMTQAAEELEGSLTATIHHVPEDRPFASRLANILAPRVGRLVHNGYPTGVTVGWAMHHGGPHPATTSVLHTSVGATAIRRFLRPIVFQDAPTALLPDVLLDSNPLAVPRRVDGQLMPAGTTGGTPRTS